MQIRAAEISDVIREQIKDYEKQLEIRETGMVLSAGDGIARIYGLEKAAAGELIEFPHGILGIVLNLEEDNVGAAIFGEQQSIKEGDEVRRTGRIADRQTGKTAVALDTISNQRGGNVHCFYVAIGQKRSTVAQVVDRLAREGAMEYTTVVVASASDPAPLQFIAPYSGCSMGEF